MYKSYVRPDLQTVDALKRRLPHVLDALEELQRIAGPLPDAIILINLNDLGFCPPGQCGVPVLSLIKRWHREEVGQRDEDILFPHFHYSSDEVFMFPWEYKATNAFFRGGTYCGSWVHQSRVVLTQQTQAGISGLDVALTDYGGSPGRKRLKEQLGQVPHVPIKEHPRNKYLLSLDGCTASFRLAMLLSMNSIVIKEQSLWIEFYYRALQPGVHLAEFRNQEGNMSDLTTQLDKLRGNDSAAQQISRRGTEFAYSYLRRSARLAYLARVLKEYVKLFGEGLMEAAVQSLGVQSDDDVQRLVKDRTQGLGT